MSIELAQLITNEGWEIVREGREYKIEAYGERFDYAHPFVIHAKRYRESNDPETRYRHFKAMHDYMWPNTLWHYWTERRFRAHCGDWLHISYAGGAATTKSYDAAKISLLFWLANPKKRAVVVASTTLSGLDGRVWGYIKNLLNSAALAHDYLIYEGQKPHILYPPEASTNKRRKKGKDTIHGIFCVAAKKGDTKDTISSWIGRHPDEALLVVLDEGTDMPPAIMEALPNLKRGVEKYQVTIIGNSCSRFDLHGAMSTPAGGWDSIDPMVNFEWETTQEKGVCLFFNCYDSPAIHETDPALKEALSKFLPTAQQIADAKREKGEDSDGFWRFMIGFWRNSSTESTIISEKFLSEFRSQRVAHWAGMYPLNIVAGLDTAFSMGGDQCILRLGILGVTVTGELALDFRGNDLMFKIGIVNKGSVSPEIQIATQVIKILEEYRCPLHHMCIDATGQGRAMAEVIQLKAQALKAPIKIYTVKQGVTNKNSFDIVIKTSYELWYAFRDFIQNHQLYGFDDITAYQLTSRLVEYGDNKTPNMESKKAYKIRMSAILPALGRSPDEADAAALCLQSAIMNFGFAPGVKRDVGIHVADNEMLNAFREMKAKQAAAIEQAAQAPKPRRSIAVKLNQGFSFKKPSRW